MSCVFQSVENNENQLFTFTHFQNLPTDALLSIFEFCDISSLLKLSQTCKRFNCIINEDIVWLKRSRSVNVTNQVSHEIQSRSFYILPHKERCRISINWNTGRYNEKIFLHQKTKFIPWTQLESNVLWLSRGSQIIALSRKPNSVETRPILTLSTERDDVSRFVLKNEKVISGTRDGSLCVWNEKNGLKLLCKVGVHSADVTDVDCSCDNLVVTGSKDKTIKVWTLKDDDLIPLMSVVVDDRVWTVASNPWSGNLLCHGTSGHYMETYPLALHDVEKCQMLSFVASQHKYGAGVLDVLWEDPFSVLSCGYDGSVRMWDTRTAKCVREWTDSFGTVLYCLASDHSHTFLCGTALHGRVQLWDKRHSKPLQMYFMRTTRSSPVYSLAFDPTVLFAALDQSLNMMDFSGISNKAVDYRGHL